MRFKVHFRREDENLLSLRFDTETSAPPTVVSGSDEWFDYGEAPYSENLDRNVTVEDPWEWAVALQAENRRKGSPVEVVIEPERDEPVETFGPELPSRFNFQHPLLKQERKRGPENADRWQDFVLAGWWRRVAAFLIDRALLTGVFLIFAVLTWQIGNVEIDPSEEAPFEVMILFLIPTAATFLFTCAYFWLTMCREGVNNGQSPGKQLMKITVIRQDGQLARFLFVFMRQIVLLGFALWFALLIFYGIIAAINFMWPLFDAKNQALHDKAARSLVVRTDIR